MLNQLMSSKKGDVFQEITKENIPPANIPFIGFSKEWIDEDFNPKGTRECFLNGDELYYSPKWCNYHDYWQTVECTPTHFMHIPNTDHLQIVKP